MISQELRNYIEKEIIPRYLDFDNAHGILHVKKVMEDSLEIAKGFNEMNSELIYVIAAFHDLGLVAGRKVHHIESAKIVRNDKFLNNYFPKDEINIIANAVEDHRASGPTPRSKYGKIVSDADRDYDFDNIIVRCINFRLELDFFDSLIEVRKHLYDKYRTGGYLKEFYFKVKPQDIQDRFDMFVEDDDYALQEFKRIYGNEVFGMEVIDCYDKSIIKNSVNSFSRMAVRGIALEEGKLLMIHVKEAGDYKFPGGGIEKDESDEVALKREFYEEAAVSDINKMIPYGAFIQKQDDLFGDGTFYQISKYYFVEGLNVEKFNGSNLDEYESELGMEPVWIDIDEAIELNEKASQREKCSPWITRENKILNRLK